MVMASARTCAGMPKPILSVLSGMAAKGLREHPPAAAMMASEKAHVERR
jgi:hypothetical protein